MACCSSCGSASACSCDPTVLVGPAIAHTLAASLVPTVDCIRDLYTCMGVRPYTVALIWTQWSDGRRGEGTEGVIREEALLPTPKVAELSLKREVQSIGVEETGTTRVSEISASYSEDFLLGRGPNGERIPADQSFYWEVRYPQVNGKGVRRRYTVEGSPTLDSMKFQWVVSLQKASEDRTRSGNVRG